MNESFRLHEMPPLNMYIVPTACEPITRHVKLKERCRDWLIDWLIVETFSSRFGYNLGGVLILLGTGRTFNVLRNQTQWHDYNTHNGKDQQKYDTEKKPFYLHTQCVPAPSMWPNTWRLRSKDTAFRSERSRWWHISLHSGLNVNKKKTALGW